jgi:AcrR family transcriptional regulator
MATLTKTKKAAPLPRKATRQYRQQQLIEATITALAQKGQTRLKLQDVAETAGLSYGLVNFHFETKEKLLNETLLYLSTEYRANWEDALARAASTPAAQLNALIQADFDEKIFTQSRVMAWSTFWGEAQSRPIYQQQCGANDQDYIVLMESICARLIADNGLPLKPDRVARVIRVTIEGVWLDMITMSGPYSRKEALRTVYTCAMAFFPKYFDEKGLRK